MKAEIGYSSIFERSAESEVQQIIIFIFQFSAGNSKHSVFESSGRLVIVLSLLKARRQDNHKSVSDRDAGYLYPGRSADRIEEVFPNGLFDILFQIALVGGFNLITAIDDQLL